MLTDGLRKKETHYPMSEITMTLPEEVLSALHLTPKQLGDEMRQASAQFVVNAKAFAVCSKRSL